MGTSTGSTDVIDYTQDFMSALEYLARIATAAESTLVEARKQRKALERIATEAEAQTPKVERIADSNECVCYQLGEGPKAPGKFTEINMTHADASPEERWEIYEQAMNRES